MRGPVDHLGRWERIAAAVATLCAGRRFGRFHYLEVWAKANLHGPKMPSSYVREAGINNHIAAEFSHAGAPLLFPRFARHVGARLVRGERRPVGERATNMQPAGKRKAPGGGREPFNPFKRGLTATFSNGPCRNRTYNLLVAAEWCFAGNVAVGPT
jgi:hypothetical protein